MAYTEPTTTDLKMRYPAFAAVDNAILTWWLAYVVGKDVDQGWGAANGVEAHMAAAAGRMAKAGVQIAGSVVTGFAAAGVTDFKSGSFSAKFSDDAVRQAIAGDWKTSPYGADYLTALEKEKGGGRVTAPGSICINSGYNGFAGPLGYPAGLFPC